MKEQRSFWFFKVHTPVLSLLSRISSFNGKASHPISQSRSHRENRSSFQNQHRYLTSREHHQGQYFFFFSFYSVFLAEKLFGNEKSPTLNVSSFISLVVWFLLENENGFVSFPFISYFNVTCILFF